jgi:hypothetical protein
VIERKKKEEEREMLVTHKPKPDPDMTGREAREQRIADAMRTGGLEGLRDLVAEAKTMAERSEIVDTIQRRYGNRMAERVVEKTRASEEEED